MTPSWECAGRKCVACSDWGPDQELSPPVSKDHATVARPGSGRRASPSAVGATPQGTWSQNLAFLFLTCPLCA